MDTTYEETEGEIQEFITATEYEEGDEEFNSPTPERIQSPEPVEFEQLIEQLDVIPSTNVQLNLEKCPICSRTFVPESLAKHVGICEKMTTKKRKKFDSSRQRVEGTDLAGYNMNRPTHATTPGLQKHHSMDIQSIKISPPKTTPLPRKFERTPSVDRKEVTPLRELGNCMTSSATSRMSSHKRVTAQVQSEMCPYCERTFGIKAYDRHVEWCKEKALLKQMNNKETVSAAKERLQARMKYRAPTLKTKRQFTREKYSGGSLSCGGSTNSLNDIGMPLFKYKDFSDRKNSFSMANSMTSSMTSESGLSDRNYDPFMSAKRQLEELFSPTTNNTSTPINATTKPTKTSTPLNNLLTTSTKTPLSTKPTTPTSTYNSNFRRTSSLRLSKKVSKPLFSYNTRSTIQRGLSPDDGPISPNFVRANEYDEIPIKSAYNALQTGQSPVKKEVKPTTPSYDDQPIIRRNSASIRKNLKLDIKNPSQPATPDFSVSKTDSLAIFLKYEQDLRDSSSCLTEKDLKDKSNSISKRSSIIHESKENIIESDRLPDIKTPNTNGVTPTTPNNNNNNTPTNNNFNNNNNNNHHSFKLEPIDKQNNIIAYNSNSNNNTNTSQLDNLINVCDNLPLKVTKLSDSDNSSSSGSSESANSQSKRDDTPEKLISSNRSSGERKNILRRQIKLNKDNILYDLSPDSDIYSEECDKKISQLEAERDNNPKFKRHVSNEADLESIFDDFDFDEFISSFEDDENYPIFKDYKNILLSRTINDSKHINRSDSDNDFSTKTPRTSSCNTVMELGVNDLKDSNRGKHSPVANESQMVNLADLSPVEKDFLKAANELHDLCKKPTYPADSDEISSIEGFPLRKSAGSKMSADSAYGSLSRQSPPERAPNRRNHNQKARNPASNNDIRMPDIQQIKPRTQLRPRDNLSMSSSGSESSLPPINSNLIKTHKMELHPHKEKIQQQSTHNNEHKMSKFCHECGSRFKLATAKFCMDCGVKRIVIE